MEEEKNIAIKFNSNADEFIEKLEKIKKLLVDIRELSQVEELIKKETPVAGTTDVQESFCNICNKKTQYRVKPNYCIFCGNKLV